MAILITKDKDWLQKWDSFLLQNNKGSHLLYSSWLASYSSYGFDFEVVLEHQDGEILGGYGAVLAKSLFFKFYIIPYGPIVSLRRENTVTDFLTIAKTQAQKHKCCYFQYHVPISNDALISDFVYTQSYFNTKEFVGQVDNKFKYVYSSYGINWVDFGTNSTAQEFLAQLPHQVRRNIAIPYKNNPSIKYAKTNFEFEEAYKIIEENALLGNYAVRSFKDFQKTLMQLIQNEQAYLIYIVYNNEIKGAALAVRAANHLVYITGGTKKEKPDLKWGYMLHFELIKLSFQMGYKGYDISMGGSSGVMQFKSKFNSKAIYFDSKPHYVVLNTFIFKLYLILNSTFAKNKKLFSKIVKLFK